MLEEPFAEKSIFTLYFMHEVVIRTMSIEKII